MPRETILSGEYQIQIFRLQNWKFVKFTEVYIQTNQKKKRKLPAVIYVPYEREGGEVPPPPSYVLIVFWV